MFTECIRIIVSTDHCTSLTDYVTGLSGNVHGGKDSSQGFAFPAWWPWCCNAAHAEPEDNFPPRGSNLEVSQQDYRNSEPPWTAMIPKPSGGKVCLDSLCSTRNPRDDKRTWIFSSDLFLVSFFLTKIKHHGALRRLCVACVGCGLQRVGDGTCVEPPESPFQKTLCWGMTGQGFTRGNHTLI